MRCSLPKTLALLACFFTDFAQAHSIAWTDSLFQNDLTSYNTSINSSFHFELGTFGSTFTPQDSNLSTWRDNWKLLDTTTYNDSVKYFAGEATQNWNAADSTWRPDASDAPASPSTKFAEGEQIYVWIYNNLAMDSTTEWGVYTRTGSGAWKIPTFDGGGQPDITQTLVMSQANTVPFGGLPTGQGSGYYVPPGGTFAYQTHNFAPVPEPRGIGLGLLAMAGFFLRRRR